MELTLAHKWLYVVCIHGWVSSDPQSLEVGPSILLQTKPHEERHWERLAGE